jgi:steroid 5-alpha reductase family enzyme
MTALVAVWGCGLTTHLYRRNSKKPEDFRYAAMPKNSTVHLHIRMFVTVYLLQFGLNYLIGLPLIVNQPKGQRGLECSFRCGGCCVCAGFAFEAVGDRQLRDLETTLPTRAV